MTKQYKDVPEMVRDLSEDKVYGEMVASHIEEMSSLQQQIDALREERDALRTAIATHRAQKADDRCIEDDDRLYEALGDGIKCDRRVGCPEDMLKNCPRFIAQRCAPGGWKSYAELEKERDELRAALENAARIFHDCGRWGAESEIRHALSRHTKGA